MEDESSLDRRRSWGTKLDEIKEGEYTHAGMVLPPPAPTPTSTDEPFVFEGEHFWDAPTDDDASSSIEYWGMASEDDAAYYFEYSTGRTQWDPPMSMVYNEKREILLWDATEQWFYLYDPKA
ncbi:Aste57867_20780 [Aphanomyces stellatus]|uniref:Aste57867_20780 protein n=1 Tax=Aphanomyces stellatus TaxID=120398 RepID=A0A485LGF0_9STRA|nr:hypothetical protein As57867_020712 [Aphanomyces stellatus]VFT97459.1 Aste57867_20780 [Aphanomyces stellatus]